MLATMDKFGRILIPKKVRKHLGIEPASEVNIIDDGKRIIIEPVREGDPIVEKDGIFVFTGKLNGDLDQELKNDRHRRLKKLLHPGE